MNEVAQVEVLRSPAREHGVAQDEKGVSRRRRSGARGVASRRTARLARISSRMIGGRHGQERRARADKSSHAGKGLATRATQQRAGRRRTPIVAAGAATRREREPTLLLPSHEK